MTKATYILKATDSQKELTTLLIQTINDANNWAANQLPEILRQLLNYGLLLNIVGLTISLLIVIITVKLISSVYIKMHKENDDFGDYAPLYIFTSIIIFLALTWLIIASINIVTICMMPKIYLLNYIM